MDIMHIDAPQEKELREIVYLWSDAFDDSEEYIRKFISSSFWKGCVVARVDDRIVAGVHLTSPTEDDRFLYGYAVATLKEYRGRGLCKKIHENIFAACREKYAVYGVHPASPSLVSLYSSIGMKPSSYRYFSEIHGDDGDVKEISHCEYSQMREFYLGRISEAWLMAGEYVTLGFDIDGVWCAACLSEGVIWEILAPADIEGKASRRAASFYGKARLATTCDTPIAAECALMTYNGNSANFGLFIE